ncbi:hypothetical protein [Clostridium sp.]|uniref:hypothetical protein n=1 Tax=Clostridium sp. TaxID=1506 RepID=UPI002FC95726
MAGKKHVIGAVLTLKDNMSATLRGVRKEQNQFKEDVKSARKELEKTYKNKIKAKLDATEAHKTIEKLKKNLEPLRKKVVAAVAYKDMMSRKLNKTTNELKSLGRRVFKPVIAITDKASPIIKNIGGKLAGIAKGGLFGAAAGVGAAGIGALKSGSELEQQQVSMGHFIGINNKDKSESEVNSMRDSFLKDLRENSNVTPFTSSEVIGAGTRALGVTGGNTKDAMELVKVAEDMAALTPGKTVQDAMEALADAKNGEMDRLKEFNAKVSAEEFEQLGFKGVVDGKLKSQFAGGAAKLSNTGAGLMSTIKGKIGSKAQDWGLSMLEKSKPMLQSIITLLDSPKFASFSKKLGDGLAFVGSKASEFGKLVTDNWTTIAGKFDWVGGKVGFFKELWSTSWSGMKEVINTTMPIIEPIWSIISSGTRAVFEGFQLAFPYIKSVVSNTWDFVSPIFDMLASGLSWVADGVGKVASWLGGKNKGNTSSGRRGGATSVDGSHANGLDYVPYDGYIAELHRGEKVVTAKENRSGKNPQVIVNINGSNMSAEEVANILVPKIKLALENM